MDKTKNDLSSKVLDELQGAAKVLERLLENVLSLRRVCQKKLYYAKEKILIKSSYDYKLSFFRNNL